jgi:ABC-type multidrug transport system fused ATPase/permease subunit
MAPEVVDAEAPRHSVPKYKKEARQVFANFAKVLKAGGSDRAHVVRVDQYYTGGHVVDAYHEVRREFFRGHVPPSTSNLHQKFLLDGQDIAGLKLSALRANIALVSQDVVLFNDTVAANIAYGAMNKLSRAEIIAAATAAHATEFISEMPDGLDTMVGENGVKLSGGQRQRLAIARALLKNAPVLILDEATSALDTESERHVQAALEVLMRGRTTIVIAHRLSTIENAHRIVVLDGGRIAESGAHAELLARGGKYAQLYRNQFQSNGKD